MVARKLNLIVLNSRKKNKLYKYKHTIFIKNNYKFLLKNYNNIYLNIFILFYTLNIKLNLFYTYGILHELIKLNYYYFIIQIIINLKFFFIIKSKYKILSRRFKVRRIFNKNLKEFFIDIANYFYLKKNFNNFKINNLLFFIKINFLYNISIYPEYVFLYIFLLLKRKVKVLQLKRKIKSFFRRLKKHYHKVKYKIVIKGVLTFRARRKTRFVMANITNHSTTRVAKEHYVYFYKNNYTIFKSNIGIRIALSYK